MGYQGSVPTPGIHPLEQLWIYEGDPQLPATVPLITQGHGKAPTAYTLSVARLEGKVRGQERLGCVNTARNRSR